ncbi:hypothetical protein I8J29_22020 [Paenibacillus sp. MWE-103]|uniref:Lipoprotein n=1 Tax=Paenibacillus artemisiicola TaxID=1172618 RepID=A0ABS3WEZ5_9BACL|nr:hypothetical protein [Paenibacillus artemisiicola]MBO7746899.1 hypothetical protein [Paenibacillus artemisiicola]
MKIRAAITAAFGLGFALSACMSVYWLRVDKDHPAISGLMCLAIIFFGLALVNGLAYLSIRLRGRTHRT